jgi:carbon-monoxide dehydrogenase large subunit
MERMMDLVARELGLDPVETRRQNLIAPGQFPYTTAAGIPYVDGDYEPVLDKALHAAGYDALKEARALARAEGRLVGIGIGLSTKGSGGTRGEAGRSSAVRIIAQPDGRLRAYTDIVAIGQGMETSFRQIVADVFGVTPADVDILQGDTTDLTPVGPGSGTYASRGLVIGGNAMHHVAGQLQEALRDVASQILECPAGDLEFADGKVSSRSDPSRSIGLGRLAAVAGDGERGFTHDGAYTLPPGTFAFAAHVAMVEVDRDTGRVSIKKYVAVHDCGREINPMIVKGQIHGGLVQGLSQALFEEVAYDTQGRPTAWSLMDYTLPLAEDIPELTVETFATTGQNGPLGVRGIGEMAAVASPAAVSNAIHDALPLIDGAEIDLPLTQERIWRALQRRAVR